MSWQIELYSRLRSREWHEAGTLFEALEQQIPLHYAMRQYVQQHKSDELPSNFEARWCFFRSVLLKIGVEGLASHRSLKWDSRVRLRYVPGRVCGSCGGPVIRAGWSGIRVACLECERPKPAAAPPSVPHPITLVVRNRREIARYLKQMLGLFSINAAERELDRLHGNTPLFLARHGRSMQQFMHWIRAHYRLGPYQSRPP